MTPEQKKHETEYLAAKKRYERAYTDKIKYERELSTLGERRKTVINEINAGRAEKKRLTSTYDDIGKASEKNNKIKTKLDKSKKSLTAASEQFKNIGDSSNGKQKDLEEVFAETNRKSKTNIENAFSGIKTARTKLNTKIEKTSANIKKLETELEQNKGQEKRYHVLISDAKRTMSSASIDMAYHKKHMMNVN